MSSKWFLSKTWPRPFYILFRVVEMFVSLVSRACNAFVLSGSTYQTTSSLLISQTTDTGLIQPIPLTISKIYKEKS